MDFNNEMDLGNKMDFNLSLDWGGRGEEGVSCTIRSLFQPHPTQFIIMIFQ